MDQKDLKAIIEQVLAEMNISGAAAETAASAAQAACCAGSAPVVEDGCIPDVTEVNIRTQYLVKNPEHGEEYAELIPWRGVIWPAFVTWLSLRAYRLQPYPV